MHYDSTPIPDSQIPRAADPRWQHTVDTYTSEINKVHSTWTAFSDTDLEFRPHPKSSTVRDILRHELLSARRFFAEFLGLPEPAAAVVLPTEPLIAAFAARLVDLALPRLEFLAAQTDPWWLETVPFFDTRRQRVWIFWRRILHTAHHRTQLTVYLRFLDKPVPPIYGPTADITWQGADPTTTLEAATRGKHAPR
jgi:uncharacterized damage-inducible protein DinB